MFAFGILLHANVRWQMKPLQKVIATPEFHHWHHEAEPGAGDRWGDPLQSLDRGEVGGYSELELTEFKDDGDRY